MGSQQLMERARELRERGCSPKQIARVLGMPPATVAPLVRAVAAAEIVFELPDLGADSRLADMHAFGCAGEVRFLGHRDEVFQLPQFHNWRF